MFKKKNKVGNSGDADTLATDAELGMQDKAIAAIKRKENLTHLIYFIAY